MLLLFNYYPSSSSFCAPATFFQVTCLHSFSNKLLIHTLAPFRARARTHTHTHTLSLSLSLFLSLCPPHTHTNNNIRTLTLYFLSHIQTHTHTTSTLTGTHTLIYTSTLSLAHTRTHTHTHTSSPSLWLWWQERLFGYQSRKLQIEAGYKCFTVKKTSPIILAPSFNFKKLFREMRPVNCSNDNCNYRRPLFKRFWCSLF